jgi:hypothetical protein
MQSIRNIVVCLILAIGIGSILIYTSCSKNKCSGVSCQNGGTCNDGNCKCPAGTGGSNCSIIYRNIYSNNNYIGNGQDNENPPRNFTNYQITVNAANDNNLANMVILAQVLTSTGSYATHFQAPVTLNNGTGTSVGFTITPTVNSNGFLISGSGTLSASTATITVTEADTATSGYIQPTIIYTFTSLAKQ